MLQIELLKYWSMLIQVIGNTLMGKRIRLICVPEDLWIQPISYGKINKYGKSWLLSSDFLTEKHQASNIVIDKIDEPSRNQEEGCIGRSNVQQAALFGL